MLPILDDLIDRFRKAQDLAVNTLINELSMPQPESGRAWHHYCLEKDLFRVREIEGIGIYVHGYGVERSRISRSI